MIYLRISGHFKYAKNNCVLKSQITKMHGQQIANPKIHTFAEVPLI